MCNPAGRIPSDDSDSTHFEFDNNSPMGENAYHEEAFHENQLGEYPDIVIPAEQTRENADSSPVHLLIDISDDDDDPGNYVLRYIFFFKKKSTSQVS